MPSNLSTAPDGVDQRGQRLVDGWSAMLRIRRAEETIAGMVESGEVRCPCHLYIGQEAVAVGVCAALTPQDTLWGGHRSHGHYLAKGGSLSGLFAEVLGREDGCSSGRGGSMHLAAVQVGIYGTVPIVAGTVPLAAGAALAAKMRGEPHVAVAFFGDGAVEEGHVHETLNLAALYKLPLVFVCENNLYSSHLRLRQRRVTDNLDQAGAFHGVPGERVDGNDVEAVYEAACRAVARANRGEGPSLLECRTFRWRGHVGASTDIDVGLRRGPELAEWLLRDPLLCVEERLGPEQLTRLPDIEAAINREIAGALQCAREALVPRMSRVLDHVWRAGACAN